MKCGNQAKVILASGDSFYKAKLLIAGSDGTFVVRNINLEIDWTQMHPSLKTDREK